MKKDKPKKEKRYAKRASVEARLSIEDFRDVVHKANIYTKGNLSEFVRQAVLGWRPLKRVER